MTVHDVQGSDDPLCDHEDEQGAIELVIRARTRSIGAFDVGRVLPTAKRRLVGPFVFFDHMGPARLEPGQAMDVRPHPHINLATVTYLFEGEIDHRDSLGSHQAIQPGAINWMTAGRGIAHSERSTPEDRQRARTLHGIQLWVALPQADEETAPDFRHYPADQIPEVQQDGLRLRVLAGTAYGQSSPVSTFSPLFYVEAELAAGAELVVPDEYSERAAYLVEGALACGEREVEARTMLVFREGRRACFRAREASRVMLIGGQPLDGKRHIWWNFVSSRPERIEQAKADWTEGRFPVVPGDESERIPLPER